MFHRSVVSNNNSNSNYTKASAPLFASVPEGMWVRSGEEDSAPLNEHADIIAGRKKTSIDTSINNNNNNAQRRESTSFNSVALLGSSEQDVTNNNNKTDGRTTKEILSPLAKTPSLPPIHHQKNNNKNYQNQHLSSSTSTNERLKANVDIDDPNGNDEEEDEDALADSFLLSVEELQQRKQRKERKANTKLLSDVDDLVARHHLYKRRPGLLSVRDRQPGFYVRDKFRLAQNDKQKLRPATPLYIVMQRLMNQKLSTFASVIYAVWFMIKIRKFLLKTEVQERILGRLKEGEVRRAAKARVLARKFYGASSRSMALHLKKQRSTMKEILQDGIQQSQRRLFLTKYDRKATDCHLHQNEIEDENNNDDTDNDNDDNHHHHEKSKNHHHHQQKQHPDYYKGGHKMFGSRNDPMRKPELFTIRVKPKEDHLFDRSKYESPKNDLETLPLYLRATSFVHIIDPEKSQRTNVTSEDPSSLSIMEKSNNDNNTNTNRTLLGRKVSHVSSSDSVRHIDDDEVASSYGDDDDAHDENQNQTIKIEVQKVSSDEKQPQQSEGKLGQVLFGSSDPTTNNNSSRQQQQQQQQQLLIPIPPPLTKKVSNGASNINTNKPGNTNVVVNPFNFQEFKKREAESQSRLQHLTSASNLKKMVSDLSTVSANLQATRQERWKRQSGQNVLSTNNNDEQEKSNNSHRSNNNNKEEEKNEEEDFEQEQKRIALELRQKRKLESQQRQNISEEEDPFSLLSSPSSRGGGNNNNLTSGMTTISTSSRGNDGAATKLDASTMLLLPKNINNTTTTAPNLDASVGDVSITARVKSSIVAKATAGKLPMTQNIFLWHFCWRDEAFDPPHPSLPSLATSAERLGLIPKEMMNGSVSTNNINNHHHHSSLTTSPSAPTPPNLTQALRERDATKYVSQVHGSELSVFASTKGAPDLVDDLLALQNCFASSDGYGDFGKMANRNKNHTSNSSNGHKALKEADAMLKRSVNLGKLVVSENNNHNNNNPSTPSQKTNGGNDSPSRQNQRQIHSPRLPPVPTLSGGGRNSSSRRTSARKEAIIASKSSATFEPFALHFGMEHSSFVSRSIKELSRQIESHRDIYNQKRELLMERDHYTKRFQAHLQNVDNSVRKRLTDQCDDEIKQYCIDWFRRLKEKVENTMSGGLNPSMIKVFDAFEPVFKTGILTPQIFEKTAVLKLYGRHLLEKTTKNTSANNNNNNNNNNNVAPNNNNNIVTTGTAKRGASYFSGNGVTMSMSETGSIRSSSNTNNNNNNNNNNNKGNEPSTGVVVGATHATSRQTSNVSPLTPSVSQNFVMTTSSSTFVPPQQQQQQQQQHKRTLSGGGVGTSNTPASNGGLIPEEKLQQQQPDPFRLPVLDGLLIAPTNEDCVLVDLGAQFVLMRLRGPFNVSQEKAKEIIVRSGANYSLMEADDVDTIYRHEARVGKARVQRIGKLDEVIERNNQIERMVEEGRKLAERRIAERKHLTRILGNSNNGSFNNNNSSMMMLSGAVSNRFGGSISGKSAGSGNNNNNNSPITTTIGNNNMMNNHQQIQPQTARLPPVNNNKSSNAKSLTARKV